MAAVVFDLDGVLVDSEPVWEQVRRGYVADHGGTWPAHAQEHLMGMNTTEWARYLTEVAKVDVPLEQVATDVVAEMRRRYTQRLPLVPGALDALARLGRRWPLGLASSSPRTLIDHVVSTSQLAGRFAVTISTEEVGRGKPAPDVYLAAADRLGASPAQCVAVEDSSNGLEAARAAGSGVVALPNVRYPPSAAALARADLVMTDLSALTEAALEEMAGHQRE